jgi:hypothetical protein
MTIKTLTVEQTYDPGFTLVAQFDGNELQFYTREKSGIINLPYTREQWGADRLEENLIKDVRIGDCKSLWKLMDNIALGEQYAREWRENPNIR